MNDADTHHTHAPSPGPTPHGHTQPTIADALAGSLPCIACGYDLRGLTVKGACPECSTAVRATILARIDPTADALKPIRHKHLLANGLRIMFAAALVALAATWAMKAQEAWPLLTNISAQPQSVAGSPWATLQITALAISGAAALTLAVPIPGVAQRKSTIAAAAVLAGYTITIVAFVRINALDTGYNAAYIAKAPDPARLQTHIAAFTALAITVLCIRPVTRPLVDRCKAIRRGRVDRQHLLVLVAVLLTIVAGSVIRLISTQGGIVQALEPVGSIVIFMASILVTVVLIRATIDAWRIAYAIDHPPLKLADLFKLEATQNPAHHPTATSAAHPTHRHSP